MPQVRKIINDPVYGFITIDHPLILQIISHPFTSGCVIFTRWHLLILFIPARYIQDCIIRWAPIILCASAWHELKGKGIEIITEEELGAKIAILLHDIGHGPFSHALENELITDVHHEAISILLMQKLNEEFKGQLKQPLIFLPINIRKVSYFNLSPANWMLTGWIISTGIVFLPA